MPPLDILAGERKLSLTAQRSKTKGSGNDLLLFRISRGAWGTKLGIPIKKTHLGGEGSVPSLRPSKIRLSLGDRGLAHFVPHLAESPEKRKFIFQHN